MFLKMISLFCSHSLSIKLCQRTVNCYIWPVLLHGCRTWTLKADTINRLEMFEMWLHIIMLRIPWTVMQTKEGGMFLEETDTLLYRTPLAYHERKIEGRRALGKKQMAQEHLRWDDNTQCQTTISIS
uniref:Uncharacterized protein LOC114329756 n=1 Tax=Diabrotica virgifera virgifera TaxID=50390 RepID=A0A6P7FP83_DIAVI